MKRWLALVTATTLLIPINSYADLPDNNTSEHKQIIAKQGIQPSLKGSEQYFTGDVHINPLFNLDNPSRSVAYVTFEANARSAWHTHPKGQLLVVTEGAGLTQQWDGTVYEIKQGDVIWCPPNIKHWHGATPNSSMTHLSIVEDINGTNVQWMEKVTDEQYRQ
ncbi:(R)-mandelonitrile lyase [Entomomonas asaccharolytica]|uniref:Cupin domain-containing protein n=1 Tax=Entomomonas asaccharolytica TaxID=2785331 RepID=A0A974NHD6_9GAMM|nr:cupin domain-containing protein [Entomomonas asaccharolytica]QQP86668.1 cupin domain-containing protein [Entomomonas asaccharolytica]